MLEEEPSEENSQKTKMANFNVIALRIEERMNTIEDKLKLCEIEGLLSDGTSPVHASQGSTTQLIVGEDQRKNAEFNNFKQLLAKHDNSISNLMAKVLFIEVEQLSNFVSEISFTEIYKVLRNQIS